MKKFTLLLSAMLLACATNLWAEDSWVKVSIDQLTSSDVFIIVDSTSGCAIPNNPENQPLAVSIIKNGALDFTNIADNLKWNITGNNTEGYVISPNGNASKRLYCINDSKGVKVGTPGAKDPDYNLFWDATANKLKQQVAADKTRWIGCYKKQDWRCYATSTDNNIKGTVTRFYKLVTVATVSVAVAEGQEEMGSVAMSYKANSSAPEWTEATEPVELAGEGDEEFQFVATPADGYKFAGWTTTGDITLIDKNAATTEGGLATETSVVTANFERNATLQSLTISGAATKVTYVAGDTFDPAGLVVTAIYSDGAKDDVTDQVDWTFDPSTLDEATTIVSVSATFKETNSAPFAVNVTVLSAPKTITIDLSKNETTTATAETLEWKGTILTITSSRTSSSTTAANNYYGGDTQKHTSTRFYKNNTLTFTPADGITLRTITYTATSNDYATGMANSTWTNAKASVNGTTVTITPTNGEKVVSATIGATTGGKSFEIKYLGEAKPTAIESVAVETPAIKTIENGQLVILRDGVKYNAMGVRLQ